MKTKKSDSKQKADKERLQKFDELSDESLVRQKQVIPDPVPWSPATLWREVKAGRFPQPIKISSRCTAWRVGDIRAWLRACSYDRG